MKLNRTEKLIAVLVGSVWCLIAVAVTVGIIYYANNNREPAPVAQQIPPTVSTEFKPSPTFPPTYTAEPATLMPPTETPPPTDTPEPTATPQPTMVPINAWGASYIKEFVTYKDGDGMQAYFIVGTEEGLLTKANGVATLGVSDAECTYYRTTRVVRAEDFRDTQVGIGSLAHDTRLWSFGRIPYSTWTYPASIPQWRFGDVHPWKVDVVLRLTLDNGRVLQANNTYDYRW